MVSKFVWDKRTIIFIIKIATQRNLAYRAISLSGPGWLPYKQALRSKIVAISWDKIYSK
jgi:hypothetical protein